MDGSICDRLPPLSAKYPWLVAQNFEGEDDTRDQIFYAIHDPLSQYRCRIPELLGKRIRGYFHGWVILSNHPQNNMWSLWNPVTSKIICLPPLILKNRDFEHIQECCLSSPPNHRRSILLLTTEKPTIVCCRLKRQTKKSRWMEMSYANQLEAITGHDGLLCNPTCFNGKVYALITTRFNYYFVRIDIMFKGKEVVINLLPFGQLPYPFIQDCSTSVSFLKGCCTGLFYIQVGFDEVAKNTIDSVHLFKLDMTSMMWVEIEDLKEATFFVDLAHTCSVFYNRITASELGGYVHILGKTIEEIHLHSYDVKNRTISLSSMPSLVLPTSHVSLWERRLQVGHGEIKRKVLDPQLDKDTKNEITVRLVRDDEDGINSMSIEPHKENMESHLLNIPIDVLRTIMEFCVGVEYLKFRATCKHFRLVAPTIRWSNGTALKRLQTYSLVSPWLMVIDKYRGIISFTDPMFGDIYYMNTPRELIGDLQIHSSRFGWLLIRKDNGPLMFYNPFTSDIRELPRGPYLKSYCFSAPPTSPDCMVVGFTNSLEWHVYIYFVAREASWSKYSLYFAIGHSHYFRFPTFCDRNLYALCTDGGLDLFIVIDRDCFWRKVLVTGPRSCSGSLGQSFLMKYDRHLLLVIISVFGESIEVFKLNDCTRWEKIECISRHMIYICGTTCICVEAERPEMANKIFFPRSHNENGKIMFYSLETRRYHTFNGNNVEEHLGDFVGTKHHLNPHTWIEPSWSKVSSLDFLL